MQKHHSILAREEEYPVFFFKKIRIEKRFKMSNPKLHANDQEKKEA